MVLNKISDVDKGGMVPFYEAVKSPRQDLEPVLQCRFSMRRRRNEPSFDMNFPV